MLYEMLHSFGKYMIKIFRGGGSRSGDTFKPPPPANNFCLYPPPVLRCFWKDPLMTLDRLTLSIFFHCYPPPIHPPPPLKLLTVHQPYCIVLYHVVSCCMKLLIATKLFTEKILHYTTFLLFSGMLYDVALVWPPMQLCCKVC